MLSMFLQLGHGAPTYTADSRLASIDTLPSKDGQGRHSFKMGHNKRCIKDVYRPRSTGDIKYVW